MIDGPEPIWQFIAQTLLEQRQREQAGEPPATPKRIKGVAECCDCCGMPLDSDAHVWHCQG